MSSKLKQLKEIDTNTKYTVSGFIRGQHKSLFKSSRYALFQNIPISISSLCTLYYHTRDYFKIFNEEKFSVTDNNKTLSKEKNDSKWINSSFASWLISSTDKCVYKWHLKVTNKEINGEIPVVIGIASDPYNANDPFYIGKRRKYYAYYPASNSKRCHTSICYYFESTATIEPVSWKKNEEEICLELDLKERKLSVYKDEKKQVVFEEIETGKNINYRLAVTIQRVGCKVSITNFQTK